MTIRRTVAVSLVFHCLIVFVSLLAIRNASMGERVLFVEIGVPDPGEIPKTASRAEPVKKKQAAETAKKERSSPPAPAVERAERNAVEQAKQSEPDPVPLPAAGATQPAARETQQASVKAGSERSDGAREPLSVALYGPQGVPAPAQRAGENSLVQQIKSAIERARTYPDLARKRRQEGAVLVEFLISARGQPENIRVTRSSGFSLLDAAAKEAVMRAAPLPAVKGNIEVLITFMLKERT
jgi:protein TonB